jgi:single-stranded DNA-binding protein
VYEPRLLERLRKGLHRGYDPRCGIRAHGVSDGGRPGRTKVYVEGTLQYRTYKDKQGKEQRSATVIVNRSGAHGARARACACHTRVEGGLTPAVGGVGELLVVQQPTPKEGGAAAELAGVPPAVQDEAPAAAVAGGLGDRGVWKV